MNGRQQCPSCERHWTPPGPCNNFDPHTGEVCGFLEAPRSPTSRPATRLPAPQRPSMPRDGYAATGIQADPTDHIAEARARLAEIRARKERAA